MLEYKETYYKTKSLDELIYRMVKSDIDDSALNMIIDFIPERPDIQKHLDKIVERVNDEKDKAYNWSNEDLIKEVEKIKTILRVWNIDFNSVSLGEVSEEEAQKEADRISKESGLDTTLYNDDKDWTVDITSTQVEACNEDEACEKAMKEYGHSDYGRDFEVHYSEDVEIDDKQNETL